MKLLLIILAVGLSILIIFLLVTRRAASRFENEIRDDLKTMMNQSLPMENRPVSQTDLTALPDIVQKYLRYTNVIGTPRISTVRIKQRGRIRNAPDQKWMDFIADEYYRVKPPGFIWHARFGPAWLPMVQVRDHYLNGSGRMKGKFLSLWPIVDAKGPEIDQGSMMRFFNDDVDADWVLAGMDAQSHRQVFRAYVDDQAIALIHFTNDVLGVLYTGGVSPLGDASNRIEGTEGYVEVAGGAQPVRALTRKKGWIVADADNQVHGLDSFGAAVRDLVGTAVLLLLRLRGDGLLVSCSRALGSSLLRHSGHSTVSGVTSALSLEISPGEISLAHESQYAMALGMPPPLLA